MSQLELEMSAHPSVKRRLWGGLRQQWKLLGLFEIDAQHEFYTLTCMMKEGLGAATQNTIDNPPPDLLSEEDFEIEVTQIHEGFRMKTFAGPVFSCMRRSLGMSEREYKSSLSSQGCYLQFISNSKSKADFFLTNDKRFFLKTQSKREVNFLLTNLKAYLQHLEDFPHSLLVKFLGVHMIKIPRQRKKYFIVMQSVFYPNDRIEARYDIKGCQVSRWSDPAPEGSQVLVVLKDMNFEGKRMRLGESERAWVLRQMEQDTAFLRRLNVLDYSLLLAHQPLHTDEKDQGLSFATLVTRATNSAACPAYAPCGLLPVGMKDRSCFVFGTRRLTGRTAHPGGASPTVPGAIPDEDAALLESQTDVGSPPCHGPDMGVPAGWSMLGGAGEEAPPFPLGAEFGDFRTQNRRLLPNSRNPLHVIDGPDMRYFVGIIDVFTVYGFWKRLEHLCKRLRYPSQSFSTVSPRQYAQRLCQWVQEHTC